jgi:N-acetyltransferase
MTFDLQPTLTGKLVELRPLSAEDFGALYAAASDPLIWEQHPERRYEPAVFEQFFAGAMESGGALAVIERATGKVIGTSRYAKLVPGEQVEIGWTFLERAYWGGRYNGEMKRLMIDHALRFVERVVFTVAEKNLRSQKAVEKIGGVRVGRETRTGPEGAPQENVVFAITKEAWKAVHA